MRNVVKRVILLAVVQLLLFELVVQLSVHYRESTGELLTMAHCLGMLIGSIWALLPAFPGVSARLARVALRVSAATALFVVLYAGNYYYSWHLRPNLGLYQEPDWVAEHPGFQGELREQIQSNTWRAAPW
ncbi:MAG TPA: hypothetical protein P5205_22050 [Candidatus Paceibacterota bacterium]|nr:hypothetical protein [Verrucomicrobiota bacterium]HSA13043.1 hypothetical protein [Candidatus Paceibacterota bacterium]